MLGQACALGRAAACELYAGKTHSGCEQRAVSAFGRIFSGRSILLSAKTSPSAHLAFLPKKPFRATLAAAGIEFGETYPMSIVDHGKPK